MSLRNDLDACQMTKEEAFQIQLYIQSFPGLLAVLRECDNHRKVVNILRVELETKNRPSFVARIIGRYNRLLGKELYMEAQQWQKEKAR